MLNSDIMKNEERVAYALRSLYSAFGYERYKMSKFEEYDLYVRNKDFLISQGIITFTDTNGKLLALKPDVTLSIIKNSKDEQGCVQKLYYDENVYRTSKDSRSFKEIAQTGLECIGDVDLYSVSEVLLLAIRSLETIDSNYVLDISHAGLVEAVLGLCSFSADTAKKVASAIQSKNSDEIKYLCRQGEITERDMALVEVFLCNYADSQALSEKLSSLTDDESVKSALEQFSQILSMAKKLSEGGRLNIDFSIADTVGYYSGVVFKGYIKGIPTVVLSGGQYDRLMEKMGKKQKAIGFAVYLDTLERHKDVKKEYDCDCVILRDGLSDVAEVILAAKEIADKGESVRVLCSISQDMKYKRLIDMRRGDKNGNA